MRQTPFFAVMFCVTALATACTTSTPTPSSPTSVAPFDVDAAADGSTLKVTAPVPVSPVNNVRPENPEISLVASNATPRFEGSLALRYRFELYDAAGTRIYQSGLVNAGASGSTSHGVPTSVTLVADQVYQWQVRAEYEGEAGPWSVRASFVAPATEGWIRGNELYDPLINGETVGTVHGPVTFIPGVGVKLHTQSSYISYVLPDTLLEGEFSILTTDLRTNTEGNKTKLFAMSEGFADIVTNDRRMTVEKRGDPAGVIAWRFITHCDQIDTIGAERVQRDFNPSRVYFWRATWRNNRFHLNIKEGGANGRDIYNFGKGFCGRPYDPDPHVVFIGAPAGRSGIDGASVDGVIIRQVWVSSRPRPAFANN
jgi:hypothetical protein